MSHEKKITRSLASMLLEDIRIALVKPGATLQDVHDVLAEIGIEPLKPCSGAAHTPDGGMQDNCSVCAPRWG